MKTIVLIILMTIPFFLIAQSSTTESIDQIEKSIASAWQAGDIKLLEENYAKIQVEFEKEPKARVYWSAYNLLHQSLITNQVQPLNQAFDLLLEIEKRTSEDYALMAVLKSTEMKFLPFEEMREAAESFWMYIEKSLELNPNNPRAYTYAGIFDFFTPAQYGGGRKAKAFLEKAEKLYTTQSQDGPKWGLTETQLYLKKIEE